VVKTVVVAEVTSNLALAGDPPCLLVDIGTPDGQLTGLVQNSVVSALVLVTVYADSVDQKLGELSPALLSQFEACLRAALGLP
jgi:hypothetical protein